MAHNIIVLVVTGQHERTAAADSRHNKGCTCDDAEGPHHRLLQKLRAPCWARQGT